MTENKIRYVLDTFKMCYQMNSLPDLAYGFDLPGQIKIRKTAPENKFDSVIQLDTDKIIWKVWKENRIPFLFDQIDNEILTVEGTKVTINFDIMTSAFYLLSGYQELDITKRDKFNRFCYKDSIQNQLNIISLPVVNYYFDILKTAIEISTGTTIKPRAWKDNAFATCITHDIDSCESAWIEGSFREFLKGKVFTPFKLIAQKFCK